MRKTANLFRKLNSLFRVPEGEKVTERHLRRVLISSLTGIVLCINCLIGTTWAWYATTVTSENNVITVGSFSSSALYQKGGRSTTFNLTRTDDHEKTLDQVGYHRWTLTNTGSIEGYYVIHVSYEDKDGNRVTESFTTETVYPLEEGGNQDNVIYLEIYISADENHKLPMYVQIIPHWGENPNPPGPIQDATIFEDDDSETTETEDDTTEETTVIITTTPTEDDNEDTEETVTETTEETVPETTEETVPETTEETVPETTEETVPETTEETVPETTEETVPETTEESVPETTEESVTETTVENEPDSQNLDEGDPEPTDSTENT